MKLFSERYPKRKPNSGYLAPCRRCGAIVVHSEKTGEPFHMHRRSQKCREATAWDPKLAKGHTR